MFEYIQFISIGLEAIIAFLFLLLAVKGRTYMYGLALAFVIYIFYDLARLLAWNLSEGTLTISFLIATLGALYSAWHLYKRG